LLRCRGSGLDHSHGVGECGRERKSSLLLRTRSGDGEYEEEAAEKRKKNEEPKRVERAAVARYNY
jgi:hypothetical protein